MADRYWVGGVGTWDATTTTNWSATSGGAGGASAPTSADNAIFDTLSNAAAYAVTVGTNANALDITIAGPLTGNVILTMGATAVINCYGSWLNASSGITFTITSSAVINFLATTTGKTITTNGLSLSAMSITLNGVGGAWSLGGALTITNNFTVTAGTFTTTASNYAFTTGRLISTNTNVRSISLNSSTVTITGTTVVDFTTATNLTFNAGASAITINSANPIFNGGGQTFNNVSFTSTATGAITITGANTFNSLTQTSPASLLRIVVFSANQTVTGTLTLGATNTAVARVIARSDTIGTQRTLTVATIATLADIDFQDIVAAGASGTWSGTRLGNGTNNSNITFGAGKTVYWNLAGAQNWNATGWATSSGGAPAVNNFPLAQDTAIFDNTGAVTGTISITTSYYVGTLNITKTGAMTIASGATPPRLFGNVTLQAATVTTGTGAWVYAAYGVASTFTSNTATFTPSLTINAPTGTVTLADAFTAPSTVTTTLTAGTLNLNSFTLTTGLFNSSNSNTRVLAFGTGNITLTGVNTTIFDTTTVTGMTITGTPVANCTATTGTSVQTRTFIAGNHGEAQSISVNINPGTSAVDIFRLATNSGAFKNVTFSSTFTGTVQISNSVFFYGNVNFGGATAYIGTSTVTFAATSGTKTISTAGLTIDSPVTFDGVGGTFQLASALTLGSTRTCTLTNGTLDFNGFTLTTGIFGGTGSGARKFANNTASFIITGNNITVVGFGTTTNLTADFTPVFELTYSGSVGTRNVSWGSSNLLYVPNINVTAGSDIVTTGGTTTVNNLTFTAGFTGTLGNATRNIYGNLTLVSGMATPSSGSLVTSFIGVSSQTITTAGKTLDFPITFNGVGGTFQLQDPLTSGDTRTCTLTNGTLDLNNFTLTTGLFSSSNSNTRAIAFGTGTITITCTNTTALAMGTVTNFSYTGTPTLNFTGVGTALETRVISFGGTAGATENNAVNINISAGSDTITTPSGCVVRNINYTGFSGTSNFFAVIYGNVTLSSSVGFSLINSSAVATFAATSGTKTITSNGKTIDAAITFNGIGGTFACQDALTLGSTRALTITNGTLQLKSGTTSTVGSFVTSGTNQKFLSATTPGSQATLSDASGTNSVSYLTIQDSNATGGAIFDAYIPNFNVNAGNNTGWNFGNAIVEIATGTDTVTSIVIFFSGVQETTTGSDAISSLQSLNSAVTEITTGTDTLTTTANFGSSVTETAISADTLTAAAAFATSVVDSATGTDSITARPPWEVIDDTQTANWTAIPTT